MFAHCGEFSVCYDTYVHVRLGNKSKDALLHILYIDGKYLI